jgi:ribosomal protein S18 acetylase RimI-like enzyme
MADLPDLKPSRTVRKAVAADAPTLTQIRNDAVAYKLGQGDFAWGKNGWTEAVTLASLNLADVYVIELDGLAVAMMSLSWQDEEFWGPQEPNAGYVHGLSVCDGFHGLGIGKFAIDWCANQMRAQGRDYLRLDCDVKNAKLCAYYESLGFTRVATKPMTELGDYVASLYEKPLSWDTSTWPSWHRPHA